MAGYRAAAPQEDSLFVETFAGNATRADVAQLEDEDEDVATEVFHEPPDAGAVVLERADFSSFSSPIRCIARVPVYHLYTLCMQAAMVTVTDVSGGRWHVHHCAELRSRTGKR